jgi:hypothetical protein
MSQEITPAHCNRCGWITNHDIVASELGLSHEEAEPGIYFSDAYDMLKCRGCGSITMRHTWGYPAPAEVTYYPPRVARRTPGWADPDLFEETVPRPICKLMAEVYTALQNNSCRLAAMGIRSALENVMVDRVGDKGTFTTNMDAFQKAGYLSVRQQGTLDSILLRFDEQSYTRPAVQLASRMRR